MTTPLQSLVLRVREWPVTSQLQARRNAMVAATACAQRRAERDDVADFLAARDESLPGATTPRANAAAHR